MLHVQTKPESLDVVLAYFEQQWRMARIHGTHVDTATKFWQWGEQRYWNLHCSWMNAADGFVRTARDKARSTKPSSGAMMVQYVVCGLCWHVIDAQNEKRDPSDQVKECQCRYTAGTLGPLANLYDRMLVFNRCWVQYSIVFGEVPDMQEMQIKINRLHERIINEHRDEYYRVTAQWWEMLGAVETNAA